MLTSKCYQIKLIEYSDEAHAPYRNSIIILRNKHNLYHDIETAMVFPNISG